VPAAELALLSGIEVVLAPVWVWIFLNETADENTLIGGAFILFAALWNGVAHARRSTSGAVAKPLA
jgi:drug/metabolite transporter (DMT)-like permease